MIWLFKEYCIETNFFNKVLGHAKYLYVYTTETYPYINEKFDPKWERQWNAHEIHANSIWPSKNIERHMNIENTQVQMRKGILEFCILHIISRGEVYASNMLEELTSAKIMVVEGTLYPLLTRLRKAGLVDYKWVESKSGPPRKYYTLTQDGADFLNGLDQTWTELVSSTKKIIANKNTKKKAWLGIWLNQCDLNKKTHKWKRI